MFGIGEAVDQGAEAQGRQYDAGPVVLGGAAGFAFTHPRPDADERDDGDGDVDEEAPAPRDELGEETTQQDSCRRAHSADGAEDRERRAPILAARERNRQERQRRRCEQRCEDALQRTCSNQFPWLLRESADEGGNREACGGCDERSFPAPEIRDPATQQQEGAENEGVGGDYPRAGGVADAHFQSEGAVAPGSRWCRPGPP